MSKDTNKAPDNPAPAAEDAPSRSTVTAAPPNATPPKSAAAKETPPQPGWWQRLNDWFNALLEERRGAARADGALPGFDASAGGLPDDRQLAIQRPRNAKHVRLVIPVDVTIAGHLMGSSDTEVAGHIDGNLAVEGRLYLSNSGRIAGDVRATACRIAGQVEGQVECTEELDLEASGSLHADVRAGKRINLAGKVYGNVSTTGRLYLAATAVVEGDVHASALMMDDGAILNGVCRMHPAAADRSENEL